MPVLTDDQLARLLAACKGAAFENIRDQAVIRLFTDTGIRASELVGLTLEDVDLGAQLAYVEGKGGRAGQYRTAYVPQTRCASTSRSDAGTFSLIRRRRFGWAERANLPITESPRCWSAAALMPGLIIFIRTGSDTPWRTAGFQQVVRSKT
ncbi:MAG TPA: site-specific integrase [Propionibacteriaceae bacterium]